MLKLVFQKSEKKEIKRNQKKKKKKKKKRNLIAFKMNFCIENSSNKYKYHHKSKS